MSEAAPPRTLGFWGCLALVVGNMIGSGVYLLPASLAPYGWNAMFGWLLTIGGGLCLAYVFGALARALPQAGGPYAYTRAAFGPLPSFLVAWAYWVTWWVGNAAIAVAGVSYLSVLLPPLATVPGLGALAALTVVWGLTWVNCRGVDAVGKVQSVTTVLKLIPLIAVILLAAMLIVGGETPVAPFRPQDISAGAITASASLTLWALLAFESATVPADNVIDPARTIPRATMWGLAAAGLIYLLVSASITLLMPAHQAAASAAPIADFISGYWGPAAGVAVAGFAAISAFGSLNGCLLVQGEMPWAMARGGVFPAWLGKSSARGVPVRAHIVSSLLLTAVMLTNYTRSMTDLFTFIALLATTSSLVAYFACSLASLKLLGTSMILRVVGSLAALYSLWTLYGTGAEAVGWGLVLLLAGFPLYFLVRRPEATAEPAGSV